MHYDFLLSESFYIFQPLVVKRSSLQRTCGWIRRTTWPSWAACPTARRGSRRARAPPGSATSGRVPRAPTAQVRTPPLSLKKQKIKNFFESFWHTHVLFWDHWCPCFGFLVTSPLDFKARVGCLIQFFAKANDMYIPWDPCLVPEWVLPYSIFCKGEWYVHSLRSMSGARVGSALFTFLQRQMICTFSEIHVWCYTC